MKFLVALLIASSVARADEWVTTDVIVAPDLRLGGSRGAGPAFVYGAIIDLSWGLGDETATPGRVHPRLGVFGAIEGTAPNATVGEAGLSFVPWGRSTSDEIFGVSALRLAAGAAWIDEGNGGGLGWVARTSWGWHGPHGTTWRVGDLAVFVEYRTAPQPGFDRRQDVIVGIEINPLGPIEQIGISGLGKM